MTNTKILAAVLAAVSLLLAGSARAEFSGTASTSATVLVGQPTTISATYANIGTTTISQPVLGIDVHDATGSVFEITAPVIGDFGPGDTLTIVPSWTPTTTGSFAVELTISATGGTPKIFALDNAATILVVSELATSTPTTTPPILETTPIDTGTTTATTTPPLATSTPVTTPETSTTTPPTTGTTTSPAFTSAASTSPASPDVGMLVSIAAIFTNGGSSLANPLVDIEIYEAGNQKVFQKFEQLSGAMNSGETRTLDAAWTAGAAGTYTVKLGLFSENWGETLHWNNGAATIIVSAPSTETNVVLTGTSANNDPAPFGSFTASFAGSTTSETVLLDLELKNSNDEKVAQAFFDNTEVSSAEIEKSLDIPGTLSDGIYHFEAGVFGPNWSVLKQWYLNLGTLVIRSQ